MLIASPETTWKDDIRRSDERCPIRRMDALELSLVLTLGRQTMSTSLRMESRSISLDAL